MTRKELIRARWAIIRWRRVHKLLQKTTDHIPAEEGENEGIFVQELEKLADYARRRAGPKSRQEELGWV